MPESQLYNSVFNLSNFDFKIPSSLIAQQPASPRDTSRLLIINRKDKSIKEGIFKDIVAFLNQGDVLVLNNTRVLKARLWGKSPNGGKLEILLLREKRSGLWETLVKPGRRAKIGQSINLSEAVTAEVLEKTQAGGRLLKFKPENILSLLEDIGTLPLPHYIKREIEDCESYQTIYAKKEGAVAAPTAGLHFTKELLNSIEKKGVTVAYVTLHCGLATFRPVKTADIRQHTLESEWLEVSEKAAGVINNAKQKGYKICAVGTTSLRALESVSFTNAQGLPQLKAFCGETKLYITPGYHFIMVDSLITNLHTPCSTNLILTASFCGLQLLKEAYAYALKKNFRFYSFGDATIII